ncbi:MAG: ATP-binding cassette domain-containing protein, partial [bacterium]
PRFFDINGGSIEIDGVDLRNYRIRDLRARFGIVTQDTILFNDTVAANITYGDDHPNYERMIEAAKAANAHSFIMTLDGDKGYETEIGQSGLKLSGGQRQRVAIARAIYRNPQILIFDEATSALDTESERQVQEAINTLLIGRTAFIVAHRLSTVRNADLILVLEDGKLVEMGRHEELIEQQKHYYSLYNLVEVG